MGANGSGTATAKTAVVDADGHVVEPADAWAGLADEHAVRIEADAHGYEHVTVGDKEILATPLGTLATPGARFSEPGDFAPLEDAWPGGADPRRRLVDMDAEGIDQAVLYPSIGLYFSALEDPVAAVAIARAYNDWLAAYCEADPDRLFGASMLPLQDPAASVDELRRAVGELGCRAAFVRPNPTMGRALSDRAYEPLWEAAEELDVAIGVHEGSSVILPTLAADRPFNPFILHAVSHSFEEMLAFAQLCAFGTFERHPGLKMVFLESSGGWAPFWTERLDEQKESFGGFCPEMVHSPSEYFARQCWISFEVDEKTLPALVPFVGEDRIVWGSDYPHHDATFPGAVEALRTTIGPCRPSVQARVLGQNAADLYGLPPRRGGPAGVADAYFNAITLQDAERLRALFADDAVLDVDGTEVTGREAIARFYAEGAFLFEDLLPQPHPLQVDGSRVTVDIDLQIAGADRRLTDRFVVEGDHIARLEVRSVGAA